MEQMWEGANYELTHTEGREDCTNVYDQKGTMIE